MAACDSQQAAKALMQRWVGMRNLQKGFKDWSEIKKTLDSWKGFLEDFVEDKPMTEEDVEPGMMDMECEEVSMLSKIKNC